MSKHSDQKTNYGISRYDDDKRCSHGWRVSLCRHGKRLLKNFPDKKNGGKQRAFRKAQQYRDELIDKFPPITRQEVCRIRRSNNSSGIGGVCTYAKRYKLRDGNYGDTWYWEASWPGENGQKVSTTFSVKKYGDEMARSMAIRARQNALDNIEGVFWVSEPGVKQKPEQSIDQSTNADSRKVA